MGREEVKRGYKTAAGYGAGFRGNRQGLAPASPLPGGGLWNNWPYLTLVWMDQEPLTRDLLYCCQNGGVCYSMWPAGASHTGAPGPTHTHTKAQQTYTHTHTRAHTHNRHTQTAFKTHSKTSSTRCDSFTHILQQQACFCALKLRLILRLCMCVCVCVSVCTCLCICEVEDERYIL